MHNRYSLERKVFTSILNVFFPPSCVVCKKPASNFLCETCKQLLAASQFPNGQFVSRFGDKIYCSTKYSKEAAGMVKSLKYARNFPAAEWIAKLLLQLIENTPSITNDFKQITLVPVPISFQKQISRGYNQCDIIGRYLAKFTGFQLNKTLLKRKKTLADKDQIGLAQWQRETNPTCKFEAFATQEINSVLLLDDICTTGKTMYECKKAIQNIMPQCQINMIVFSHPQDSRV